MMEDLAFIGQIAVKSSIAVLLATLGEIVAERSGILNLGVEGMMLVGALCGVAAGVATGNPVIAAAVGALAGGLLALVHGFFAITLRVNQVLSGLALTILGMGMTSFVGRPLIGTAPGVRLRTLPIPGLADIPIVGDILFRQSALAYLAYILVPLCWFVLFRTGTGLKIRAAWEDAAADHRSHRSRDRAAPAARRWLSVVQDERVGGQGVHPSAIPRVAGRGEGGSAGTGDLLPAARRPRGER